MKKEFFIAGVQFRPKDEIERAVNVLEEGMFLAMEPEPTNKYDSNAVKLVLDTKDGEIFLGYIPAKFSAEISAALEIGDVVCEVTALNPAAKPWEKIKVVVTNEEYKEEEEVDFDHLDDADYIDGDQ